MHQLRTIALPATVALLAVTSLSRPVAASPSPRVGYLGAAAAGVDEETRHEIDAGAAAGIKSSHGTYVRLSELVIPHTGGAPCLTVECVAQLAGRSDAEYFISVEAHAVDEGTKHQIKVQVIRARPFGVMFVETFDCLGCIPVKVGERTENNVSLLVTKLIDALGEAPVVQGLDGPSSPQATPPGQPLTPVPPPRSRLRRNLGIAFLSGAGAGLVAGGVLLLLDGRQGSCQTLPDGSVCDSELSLKKEAIVTLSAAAIIGVAGFLLMHGSDPVSATQAEVGVGSAPRAAY